MNPAPSHQPEIPAGDRQWLVHCSPERTLVARRQDDTTTLVKIFEQGSLLEAKQEAELAVTLAQPGVVTYTDAGLDPVTNKPCVRMEFFEGTNLERKIAESGPLTSIDGARLILQLTQVLADFHNTPRPVAAHGVAHRDVKPANVFLANTDGPDVQPVLIDLEHAIALQAATEESTPSTGFTGGTHGYSAPESYLGDYPTPAFDIFGLGATFFYVLTGTSAYPQQSPANTAAQVCRGCSRLVLLRGQPPILRDLIASCLAVDPLTRPGTAQVAALLKQFLGDHGKQDDSLDSALQAIQAGEYSTADVHLEEALAAPGNADPRHHHLIQLASTRSRMLTRIGGAPDCDLGDLVATGKWDELAHRIATDLPRIETFLRRYPLHSESLDQRRSVLSAGHRLLESVLPVVAKQKSTAQFEEAGQLLERTTAAAHELGRVSGGLSLPTTDPGHLPGPLLRNPGQILDRSTRDIANTKAMHEILIERLHAAEAKLDLARVGIVVDEITTVYSGASQVAAQMRDRLHQLDFYVQRISTPNRLIDQLADLLELGNHPHQLDTVRSFIQLCGDRTFRSPVSKRAKGGIRGLLDTMEQLLEEFPHATETSGAAATALREAMSTITERAWEHVQNATEKLQATPVPIRPVQNLINRIDAIRMLESFLDQPERSREQLQDEIERVRLRLDQARTTRDNIARGAEEAMERGHLTTALYDMERAVKNFEGEVADDPADPALVDRLEEAKRRKLELEIDIVENHRLTARYVELVEDDESESTQRVSVLEQRSAVLERLVKILGADRGAHYQTDLRDVVSKLIQEKADQGERELDEAKTSAARAKIAKATLAGLLATMPESEDNADTYGRTKRIFSHWRHKCLETREQRDADRQEAEISKLRDRRKTQMRVVIPMVIVTILLGIYGFNVVYGRPSSSPPVLAEFTKRDVRLERGTDGKLTFAADVACNELAQFAANRLDPSIFRNHTELYGLRLPALANRLTTHLMSWKADQDRQGLKAWANRLDKELSAFDKALETLHQRAKGRQSWLDLHRQIADFGRYAHITGLNHLATGVRDAAEFEDALNALKTYQHIDAAPELVQIRVLLPKKN